MKKFLTAKWRDLVMANYEVAPELLLDYLPQGTKLDFYDGKCFVSLVAFMFLDTRVLGFRVPFHVNFEEVNLRFYVRRETLDEVRRGVVFIKEIVPRFAIATVARIFYGEPYEAWRMNHSKTETDLSYEWQKGNSTNQIKVKIGASSGVPDANSSGEFIIEHYWGYTKRGATRTDEYKVEHSKWELFAVEDFEIEADFGETYGEKFAFLRRQKPYSILLAKGSPVAVYKGAKLVNRQ
ncbi:MAG: YqjF family protein [Pyrinomonadaceae bacterium]